MRRLARLARLTGAASIGCLACLPAVTQAQRPQPRDAALEAALRIPTNGMIRGHLTFLSHDLLAGRAPGTPGGQIAAHYIAAQFAAAGLEPAIAGGWFQPVPLAGVTPEPSLLVGVGRQVHALGYGEDFVAWPLSPDSTVTADAELVFVGYGIQAREWNWDDYKGELLTGKILLMLANDPGLTDASRFRGRALTAYGHWSYKLQQAARAGAAGVILIHNDTSATMPWAAVKGMWMGELVTPPSPGPRGPAFAGWISETALRRIMVATGRDYDALRRRAQQPDFRPISLGAHAAVHVTSRVRSIVAHNVVARLPGSDSALAREAVLLIAHYDHLGTRPAAGGDSIYNGALDNASGVATLLAAATALGRAPVKPRRSIVFLATTAGEPASLGARSYLDDPPTPLELTTAVINIDRANLHGVTLDAVAIGADQSDLGPLFARAASDEGLVVSPDPTPERGAFYSSDHYPFAVAGVPALLIQSGTRFPGKPADWGLGIERQYLRERHHQPTDEVVPDMDVSGALQQARIVARLAWELANAASFPQWHEGTEFRGAGDRLRARRLQYRR